MSFLGRLNGWQRLWLVTTALTFVCAGLLYPLAVISQGNPGQKAYREALLKDLRAEKCLPYITRPMSELREPPISLYGLDCSAIYLSRRAESKDIHPYSIEIYDAREAARKLEGLFPLVALSTCFALAASALLYAVGVGIAWTRQCISQAN